MTRYSSFSFLVLFCVCGVFFAGCWKEKEPNASVPPHNTANPTNTAPPVETETKAPQNAKDESEEPVVLDIPDPDEVSDAEKLLETRAEERVRPGDALGLTPGVRERDVLEKMVKTYQSAFAYGDNGKFVLEYNEGEPESWPCTFAFGSPNLVRMEISFGQLVSNGEDVYGQMYLFDKQVLKLPSPNRITLSTLYPDRYLFGAMNLQIPPDVFYFPPQIVLLFAKDPLKTFVPDKAKIFFEEPQWLNHAPCERIVVESPEGNHRTLWIDRQTFTLMRIDFSFDYLNSLLEEEGETRKVTSLRLELENAAINASLSKEVFILEHPADAVIEKHLSPWSLRLLGKKLENYDGISIKSLNNDKEIPLSQYAERINVLLFWTSEIEDSAIGLQETYEVYKKYKDDARFRFIAVNCDEIEDVPNETIVKILGETWKTPLPPCRLPDFELLRSLQLYTSPTLVILEPQGVVSRYFLPGTYNAEVIEEALKEILAGKSPLSEMQAEETLAQQEHAEMIRRFAEEDVFRLFLLEEESQASIAIAPRKLPEKIRLEEIFSIKTLRNPANILTISPSTADETPKFLIPYEQNSLALLDVNGKVLDIKTPSVFTSNETISFLRTGVDGKGNRFYVAFSPSSRLHILNENFESRGFYPTTRVEAEESFIFDARIADLDGDKEPEIILAMHDLSKAERSTGKNPVYSGSIRVLKLDGSILWRNDEISLPYQLGIVYSKGTPTVVAMNVTDDSAVLYEFDSKGNRSRLISLDDGNPIGWLVVDDTEGKGDSQICVYVPHRDEKDAMHLAEIDRDGVQDWKFPVISVPHSVPVDRMIAADLVGDAKKEWLLTTPDGVLQILENKGKKIAEYAHGKTVTGFNVLSEGKRRILLIADPETITGYEVH